MRRRAAPKGPSAEAQKAARQLDDAMGMEVGNPACSMPVDLLPGADSKAGARTHAGQNGESIKAVKKVIERESQAC